MDGPVTTCDAKLFRTRTAKTKPAEQEVPTVTLGDDLSSPTPSEDPTRSMVSGRATPRWSVSTVDGEAKTFQLHQITWRRAHWCSGGVQVLAPPAACRRLPWLVGTHTPAGVTVVIDDDWTHTQPCHPSIPIPIEAFQENPSAQWRGQNASQAWDPFHGSTPENITLGESVEIARLGRSTPRSLPTPEDSAEDEEDPICRFLLKDVVRLMLPEKPLYSPVD
ncbi:hypothetical protein VTO42DRAFT_5814 [Malbranchea cinnamomea]